MASTLLREALIRSSAHRTARYHMWRQNMNRHLLNYQMLRQAYLIPLWRQNMNRHLLKQRRWLFTVLLVSLGLTLVLSACNQDSGNGSSTGATQPPVATAASIQLGPQPCPAAVQSAAHWATIVGTSAT